MTKAKIDALNKQFEAYIRKLRVEWIAKNRVHSQDVYEVMRPEEQARVRGIAAQWPKYITPLAEAWWSARGYGLTWPNDDSQPVKIHKLSSATLTVLSSATN